MRPIDWSFRGRSFRQDLREAVPEERRILVGLLILLAVLLWPRGAAGQGWDVPRLMGPVSPVERSAMWTRFNEDEGAGDGFLVTWAFDSWNPALSLRGGGVVSGEAPRGLLGLDVRVPIDLGSLTDGGLVGGWSSGLGVSVGEENDTRVNVPVQVGVTLPWTSGQVWAAPYVTAGASFEWRADAPEDVEEFETHPVVEAGLDLSLDPGRVVVLRLGGSLVGRRAFGVGVALPR